MSVRDGDVGDVRVHGLAASLYRFFVLVSDCFVTIVLFTVIDDIAIRVYDCDSIVLRVVHHIVWYCLCDVGELLSVIERIFGSGLFIGHQMTAVLPGLGYADKVLADPLLDRLILDCEIVIEVSGKDIVGASSTKYAEESHGTLSS